MLLLLGFFIDRKEQGTDDEAFGNFPGIYHIAAGWMLDVFVHVRSQVGVGSRWMEVVALWRTHGTLSSCSRPVERSSC